MYDDPFDPMNQSGIHCMVVLTLSLPGGMPY
jgi:hypothetical protein